MLVAIPGEDVERKLCVARCKSTGKYATTEKISGWDAIGLTDDLGRADNFGSPAGIMSRMGGHYRGFEPLFVTLTYSVGDVGVYPPESDVWPADE